MSSLPRTPLLGDSDPPPAVIREGGRPEFLLIGDHAGNAIPGSLEGLGVSANDLGRHIGWDLGVRALGEALAAELDATFIRQSFSRLVIDCNRDPRSAASIVESSDGTFIPGNARSIRTRARSAASPSTSRTTRRSRARSRGDGLVDRARCSLPSTASRPLSAAYRARGSSGFCTTPATRR